MNEELKQYAMSLGLEIVDESEESISCIRDLNLCKAKRGPITSWFYSIKEPPGINPVFFSIQLLNECKKDRSYRLIREYDDGGRLETPSGTLKFGIALSKFDKPDAIVTFGYELVSLSEIEQYKFISHKIDGTGYKVPKFFKEMALGVLYE